MPEHTHECDCQDCAWHGKYVMYGHPRFMLLRWLVLILAMFVVFWLGMKIGEFTSGYNGYYGYGPMMYRMYYFQPGNMMYQRQPGAYGNYNNQTQTWPYMMQPNNGNSNLLPQQ